MIQSNEKGKNEMTLSRLTERPRRGPRRRVATLTPTELFTECLATEQQISITDTKASLPETLKNMLLTRPLFVKPLVGEIESLKMQVQRRFPFDFSIIKPKRLAMPDHEWRRSQVAEYLKRITDAELRLLLVARWLGEEGLCNAEDILPRGILNSLVERFRKERRISPTTIFHKKLVENWLPYFERLFADLHSKRHLERDKDAVADLGYDKRAIGWAWRKRAATEATFGWLGECKHIDARNLRNSYSKLRPHPDTDL